MHWLWIGLALPVAGGPPIVEHCRTSSAATSLPLIELYTSEGCSSCPPADRWLSEHLRAHPETIALAFHVDYWDYLGWSDRFADAAYSRRQHARVRAQGERVVYTPQLMAGPKLKLDWRGLAVNRLTPVPAIARLEMRASRELNSVAVELNSTFNPDVEPGKYQLLLALYSDSLQTQVRRGENSGELLRHDRVVRALFGPYRANADGSLRLQQTLRVPDEPGSNLGWVAWFESVATRTPAQALSLSLHDCH